MQQTSLLNTETQNFCATNTLYHLCCTGSTLPYINQFRHLTTEVPRVQIRFSGYFCVIEQNLM